MQLKQHLFYLITTKFLLKKAALCLFKKNYLNFTQKKVFYAQ